MGTPLGDECCELDTETLPAVLSETAENWFRPSRLRPFAVSTAHGPGCDTAVYRITVGDAGPTFEIDETNAPPDLLDLIDDVVALNAK